MGQLMTARQVAERFQVSTKTVARWQKEGKITSRRTPGGQHRYDSDEIDQLTRDGQGKDRP